MDTFSQTGIYMLFQKILPDGSMMILLSLRKIANTVQILYQKANLLEKLTAKHIKIVPANHNLAPSYMCAVGYKAQKEANSGFHNPIQVV